MSADDTVTPEQTVPVPKSRAGMGGFADRWPFRRKLNLLVGAPLLVVALLMAYVISGLVGQAQNAASAARLVLDSRQVARLVDLVEAEHAQAVLLSVRYESATSGIRPSLVPYRQAQHAVDAQVTLVRREFGPHLPPAEDEVLKQISGLGGLRATIEQSYLPADNIDPAYTTAVDDLIDGLGLDMPGDLSTTRTGNLLDSLLRAESAHGTFETGVFSAQTGDANALIEYTGAVGSYRLYTAEAERFQRFATDGQRRDLAAMEQGTTWNDIAMQYAGLQIDPSSLETKTPAQVRASLDRALASYPEYQNQAQNRLKVTDTLINEIAHRANKASDDAWWRAATLLAAGLLAFVVWLALSVTIRRSVIRPVQALTGAATQVAEVAGQELARVADDDAAEGGPPRLREVPITARDEIGDLAAAFNRVQTTAAALLERQVLSRRNVAEMFGNVGRRVSNLTARQLSLIDAVERGETDPELLERLYRIDHLAVRLQRNADSLMLLAGIRETGMDSGPTELTNVVRAALGQIEDYQRVVVAADTGVTVAPDIIADLTLMLAELLENAVAFSPARTQVEVSVRTSSDGALISVADHGLGMSTERLAEENARLIRRERLDLVPTKVLGLFVVGSLARRWGVRVTLTRTPGGGVTSQVAIPSGLLLMMSPFAAPPVPEHAALGPLGSQRPQAPESYRQPAPERQAPPQGPMGGPAPYQQSAGYGRTPYEQAPYESYESAPYEGAGYANAGYDTTGSAGYGSAPYQPAAYEQAPYEPTAYESTAYEAASYESAPYESAPYEAASYESAPYESARYEQAQHREPEHYAPAAAPYRPDYDAEPVQRTAYAPAEPEAPAPPRYAAPAEETGDHASGLAPLPRRMPRRQGGPVAEAQATGPVRAATATSAPRTPSWATPDPAPVPPGRPADAWQTSGPVTEADAYPSVRGIQDAGPAGRQNHGTAAGGGRDLPAPYGGPAPAPAVRPRHGSGAEDGTRGGHVAPASGREHGHHTAEDLRPALRPAPGPSGAAPTGPTTPSAGRTPLRRRVRGATLKSTWGTGAEPARPDAPRPVVDAEEVRSELDEFEAAIERANRDTRTSTTDEGAEQ